MKILRAYIISAKTCGGLLDGLDISLRETSGEYFNFDPLCLIGPNGAGKSQFLQVLAEIFQSVFHACVNKEERHEGNPDLLFEIEYLIRPEDEEEPVRVKISRKESIKKRQVLTMQWKSGDNWKDCELISPEARKLLPSKVVGYTSGENETLSLPFLISRSGYADEVGRRALDKETYTHPIPDTRLMLIDYGTNLEVLVANLLLCPSEQCDALLTEAQLKELHSCRCVVQLAHTAAPKAPKGIASRSARKGVQLTEELEEYIGRLKRCATCYDYDDKKETYIFDYWINDQTKTAFNYFWKSSLELYSALHKLAMLNDLAIPKKTRERFRKETDARKFASRLPEPQDEEKIFRFERVCFVAREGSEVVDYVSLSDGEHQLGQLLGTFCMLSFPTVLFLLDEPESHFNPQWRVRCISKILDLPTDYGKRRGAFNNNRVAEQECLITTHAPFLPSDMPREKIFIFSKEGGKLSVRHPDVETYGTSFDTILEECFDVRPPISKVSLTEIESLMHSNDPKIIKDGIARLGHSVEKMYLADRLRQLTNPEGK